MSTPQMSVQLYSVREALAADPADTLRRLAELGLRNVEAFDFVTRAAELAPLLQANALAAPTGHAMLASERIEFGDHVVDVPGWDETFAAATALGMQVVIDPMVVPARWADRDQIARTAQRLNEAADAAAAHGLKVGYHNHAHEFAHSFDGVSGYELFASLLDEKVVLELDAFWAHVAGQDVPALVRRLGSRVVALHIKDGVGGADPFTEGGNAGDQRPAGEGTVPLDAVLDASSADFAIIEFDDYAGDIFEGIAASVQYLAGRGIR